MDFSSPLFLFLFLPLFVLLYLLIGRRYFFIFLISASLLYYAWEEPRFVLPLLLICGLAYLSSRLYHKLSQRQSKLFASLSIVLALAPLAVTKYAFFLGTALQGLIPGLSRHLDSLAALPQPLGISFFTFSLLSFLLDSYRADEVCRYRLKDLLLYVPLFAKITAGPITSYDAFADQLEKRKFESKDLADGLRRFIRGLAKKVLIANTLGRTVDIIFAVPAADLTTSLAWFGAIAFTIQIYFDFAGYSDMAIGLGRMVGLELGENFNFPYLASSVKEFWKRWHISLSEWFQKYLFLPLAFSSLRRLKKDIYLGIKSENWSYFISSFATMTLCGLWHGANWTFVVWGSYYGMLLILEHAWLKKALKKKKKIYKIILTQLLVILGWVVFRAPDLAYAGSFLGAMAGLAKGDGIRYHLGLYLNSKLLLMLTLGIVLSFPILDKIKRMLQDRIRGYNSRLCRFRPVAIDIIYLVILAVSILELASATYNPFIYARF